MIPMVEMPPEGTEPIPASAPFSVVSIGDLVADVVLQVERFPVEAGKNQMMDAVQIEPGGAGNFLITGARLGMHMRALGVVGADDPFAHAVLTALLYEGVDIHHVTRQRGGTTTIVFVLTDGAGRHVFLGRSGDGEPLPFGREWEETLLHADAAVLWGYTLNEARLAQSSLEAARFAAGRGIPVFFDPGPFMGGKPEALWREVLACSSAVLLTEEEFPAFACGEDAGRSAAALLACGPGLVCVKRGARGCALFTSAEQAEHVGFDVQVRDTTAAGDAFAAGFLYASLNGCALQETAAFANAVGAAKVQKLGSGRQAPTREEVRTILAAAGQELTRIL